MCVSYPWLADLGNHSWLPYDKTLPNSFHLEKDQQARQRQTFSTRKTYAMVQIQYTVSSVAEPVRFWPAPGFFSPAPAPAPVKSRASTIFYNTPPSFLEKIHLFLSIRFLICRLSILEQTKRKAFRICSFSSKLETEPDLQIGSGSATLTVCM